MRRLTLPFRAAVKISGSSLRTQLVECLGFRHVGRLLHCAAGQKFAEIQPLSQVGSDEPAFAQQFANIFLRGVNNILSGRILSEPGPGTFGPLFRFLPPEIRDHLQDSYYKALTSP